MDPRYTCCFFGHRTIERSEELVKSLSRVIENLIVVEGVHTFLFGSKSQFDELCHETVTRLKEKHPHVKRIYVRAEYPFIDKAYEDHLRSRFERTYFPEAILHAGKAVYIERNFEMIEQSAFCVVYAPEGFVPAGKKSGTRIALNRAQKKNRRIFLLP